MRILVFIFISINFLFALKDLSPTYTLKASGNVQALFYEKTKLYAASDNGVVEIFDTNTKAKIKTIKIPKIKDFMGDIIDPKVYSIDKIDNKLLIVSQGMRGYRDLWIYENDKLEKAIDIKKKYYIQKASFINKDTILLGLLSNQMIVYDIVNKKVLNSIQVSTSSFSHFMMDEDRGSFATTDESGIVRVFYANTLTLKKEIPSKNVDKVFKLDFKKHKILTAGQDRRSVFYDNRSSYYLEFGFLLYSCALSADASIGAVAYNEENDILVFDTNTQNKLYRLTGSEATLNEIIFISKDELFSSSDHNNIHFWKLK